MKVLQLVSSAYAYRALRANGTVEHGTLLASSDIEAIASLERGGTLPIEVRHVASRRDRRRTLSATDLGLGLRILAHLLSAGLPVARALDALRDLAPPTWRVALPPLRDAIKEGKSLATALRDAPIDIPPLVLGMTMAGETAGDVAGAIRRAAEITEFIAETRAAVRSALAYPLLLGVAGAAAIAIMITVVIPRFAGILSDLGQTLPTSTRIVMSGATTLRRVFFPVLAVALSFAVAVRLLTASPAGRRRSHAMLLRIPVLGSLRHATATARSSVTLATLLDAGVPMRQSLAFAAQASGDAALAARVVAARARVEGGDRISRALGETRAFTPLAVRLVHAGEETGRLTEMLRHAARLEQDRADRTTRSLVRLLEPALVLVFAGVVALVAAALLQAVYSIRPTA